MSTITYRGTLVVTSCWCGIHLAVPEDLYIEANRREQQSIYCPLGHTFVFGDTIEKENRRLKQELEVELRNKKFWKDEAHKEERKAAAARGQVTKIKNRVKNGVCPFCNRHFENLERHMHSKHADEKVSE